MKKTFYSPDRSGWRNWLKQNYKTEKEIWFVFPYASSGEPSLSYNDAVEEALCFGWIDSTAGTLDGDHGIRRFTKRKPGSPYSRPNIERLIWLSEQGMLLPEIYESVKELIETPYEYPEDILSEIRKDAKAWHNFESFTEPYKRIRVAYIDAARNRPGEYTKRLENFISKTKDNKLIVGYGGIDKYYK